MILKVITPMGVFFEGDIEGFSGRSGQGAFQLLPGHSPWICALPAGSHRVDIQGRAHYLTCSNAMLKCRPEEISLLAESAHWQSEADQVS